MATTTLLQKGEEFGVLLVDDDLVLSTGLTRTLRAELGGAKVFTARSVAEAQLLLAEYKIHFFILDIQLPDGTGIDFLCDIQTANPEACVVIITATPLPEYREQSQALGVLRFKEKPVDIADIISLAREHQDKLQSVAAREKVNQFAASRSCLSSMDIIQLKCLSGTTQTLEFIAPQGSGRIYFHAGEIIHAETQNARGETAFEQIVAWRGGRVVEIPDSRQPPRTITMNWQSLLLNVAHRLDEERANIEGENPSPISP